MYLLSAVTPHSRIFVFQSQVLAYISGHEHDLQHIPASHDGTPHLVISGAGSDANAGDGKPVHGPSACVACATMMLKQVVLKLAASP